jgi:hypothetical protein
VIIPKGLGASGAESPRGFVTAKRRDPSNEIANKSPTGPSRGQPAKPIAAPTPDPEAGLVTIGGWRILGLDSTKKRAAARCLHCSAIREISIEALRNGGVSCGCGCRSRRSAADTSSSTQAFSQASRVVGLRKRARS